VSQAAPFRRLKFEKGLQMAALMDGLLAPPGTQPPYAYLPNEKGVLDSKSLTWPVPGRDPVPTYMSLPALGNTSGGFMSDIEVEGELNMGSQQQFLVKDT
jgi:hypothetical protein